MKESLEGAQDSIDLSFIGLQNSYNKQDQITKIAIPANASNETVISICLLKSIDFVYLNIPKSLGSFTDIDLIKDFNFRNKKNPAKREIALFFRQIEKTIFDICHKKIEDTDQARVHKNYIKFLCHLAESITVKNYHTYNTDL